MAASEIRESFKPALLVVDMQEDFCPPDGSLAVVGGRDIAELINELLALPFVLKVATRDFHPKDHISFDTSQCEPNNKPFESSITITNPFNRSQKHEIPIWPVHCVQGTKGAKIIPQIQASKLDEIVDKGKYKNFEMFSGFADVFGNKSSGSASIDLAALLKSRGITHVFAVGLAGDFCVKCTALDAQKEGFQVCVVEDVTRSVDPGEKGWAKAKKEMETAGIKIVGCQSPEIDKESTKRISVQLAQGTEVLKSLFIPEA